MKYTRMDLALIEYDVWENNFYKLMIKDILFILFLLKGISL